MWFRRPTTPSPSSRTSTIRSGRPLATSTPTKLRNRHKTLAGRYGPVPSPYSRPHPLATTAEQALLTGGGCGSRPITRPAQDTLLPHSPQYLPLPTRTWSHTGHLRTRLTASPFGLTNSIRRARMIVMVVPVRLLHPLLLTSDLAHPKDILRHHNASRIGARHSVLYWR